MEIIYIACPDLSENKFVSIFVTLKNAPYRLTFKWNEYCDCCFMSIFDSEGNPLNAGNALTTKSIIESDNVNIEKANPIVYDPTSHSYYALGEKVGKAFCDGYKLK